MELHSIRVTLTPAGLKYIYLINTEPIFLSPFHSALATVFMIHHILTCLFAIFSVGVPTLLHTQVPVVGLLWATPDSAPVERGRWAGPLALRTSVPLSIVAARKQEISRVELELRPEGPLTFRGTQTVVLGSSMGGSWVIPIRFQIPVGQQGTLTAVARVTTAAGQSLEQRSTLYVVADSTAVYLSSGSFTTVELKRLRAALVAGRISPEEFERRAQVLLVARASSPTPREPR